MCTCTHTHTHTYTQVRTHIYIHTQAYTNMQAHNIIFLHFLFFTAGPDSITFSPPSPVSVTTGDNTTVTCSARCVPQCYFNWTHEHRKLSSGSTLKLADVSEIEAGNYTCTATNPASSQSKSNILTVLVNGEYKLNLIFISLSNSCIQ